MLNIVLLNEDVIHVILTHINDSTTYMHCLSLCTNAHSFLMKTHEDKITSLNLGIISLYRNYPHLPWNKNVFIQNPSIRIKDIISYPEIFTDEHYVDLFLGINDKYGHMKYRDDLPLHVIEEIISNNHEYPIGEIFLSIKVLNNRHITFTDRITIPDYHVDFKLNGMTIMELESSKELQSLK